MDISVFLKKPELSALFALFWVCSIFGSPLRWTR